MRDFFASAIFACHRLYYLPSIPVASSHYKQPSMVFLLNAGFQVIHSLAWQSVEIAQCHQLVVLSTCT
jgi:hypothetical protein